MPPAVSMTVAVRCSTADVHAAVASAVLALTGGGPGPARGVLVDVGNAVLGQVRRAFLTKSRGGTDEAGDRWEKLKRITVERKRAGRKKLGILRSTDALLDSLSPAIGTGVGVSQVSGRVFRLGRSSVTVGSNRPGAAAHHRGVPGRLPCRRLWPEISRWPASWWADIKSQVVRGIVESVVRSLQGST